MDINNDVNVLVYAYLGDVIYENFVRKFLISKGINNVNDLQKEAINYSSARAQASILNSLIDDGFFEDDELDFIRKARNYKGRSHPKNCDSITYKYATAFEALIGYYSYVGNDNRIKCIMERVLGD